jgi:NAD-reducing hydrogenase large subunit
MRPLTDEVRQRILDGIPQGLRYRPPHAGLLQGRPGPVQGRDRILRQFPLPVSQPGFPRGPRWSTTTAICAWWTADRKIIADKLEPTAYHHHIGEASLGDSYLKSPYFKPFGYPDSGMYRVGPLARLNCCDRCGTPLADRELLDFRALRKEGAVLSSFYYHHARLVEILYAWSAWPNCATRRTS